MRALVTGGAGFVGSHLVDALLEQGHIVTVVDWLPARNRGAISVIGDLFLSERLDQAMRAQDVVYHFAAHADPHKSKDHPASDLEQNVLATARVLDTMHRCHVPRIVFASSSSVYGDSTVFPTPEDAPMPNQTSLYGASKLAAEGLISAYTRSFGMRATIFRFAPMLGEGYRRGHVRDFYDKIKADSTRIQVLGNGEQRRSYVYVKDAIAAVTQTNADGTFNVSADHTASVNESLGWICDELGVTPERDYTESWAGDKPLTLLDTSRLRGLGWSPQISIEEAVRRTVRSFA